MNKWTRFKGEVGDAFVKIIYRFLFVASAAFVVFVVTAGAVIAFYLEAIVAWMGWSLVIAAYMGFGLGVRRLRGVLRRLIIAGMVTLLICACLQIWLLDGLPGSLFASFGYGETVYSEGYSDSKFRLVYPGMSELLLLKLLKSPLREVWIYGNSEQETIAFSREKVEEVTCGWDKDCKAVQEHFPVGTKKESVLRSLGEPSLKSFFYSRWRYSDSHRVRVIRLSRGVVVEKEAYYYSD